LGYEPCYHGDEIFQRPDHVEIRAVFPDAKVILTKRNADDWYESFKASLYQAMISPEHAPVEIRGALKMAKAIVLDHAFSIHNAKTWLENQNMYT
jgi:hypothetical protein